VKVKVLSKYEVELISIEDKDKLMKKYEDRFLYEERADIYGCCIKLLTDIKYAKERWEENFYPMSAHVRSHGRLIVTEEEGEKLKVLYDQLSKTAILVKVVDVVIKLPNTFLRPVSFTFLRFSPSSYRQT
jgi:hypothetical protein